jgi:hypothetical protein
MRKFQLTLVAGAMAVAATPAIASTIVAGPFKTSGQCHAWLPWKNGSDKKEWIESLSSGLSPFACQQIKGGWYVLYG